MRRLSLALLAALCLLACGEEAPTPPGICQTHCITDPPPSGGQVTCCDSITCYYDEEAGRWQVIACDLGPDAGID